jgi:hypothetical protein
MADVFLSKDTTRKCHVVIKLLRSRSPESQRRLGVEVEILSNTKHPGIVRTIAFWRTQDGQPYMALEHLAGESLSQTSHPRTLAVARRGGLADDLQEDALHAQAGHAGELAESAPGMAEAVQLVAGARADDPAALRLVLGRGSSSAWRVMYSVSPVPSNCSTWPSFAGDL